MDFAPSAEQLRIQDVCRQLAADFATRAAAHDRDASLPVENFAALRDAGLFGLIIPEEFGGLGGGLLGYTLAAEELARGCASTAMSFNMHPADLCPLFMPGFLSNAAKQRLADLAVKQGKLFAGLLSEPGTTSLLPTSYACSTQARRVSGGRLLNGKKAFASMVEAADYACLYVHPEEVPSPQAAMLVTLPLTSSGIRIEHVWDTLGMRGTRSENVILEDCFVAEENIVEESLIASLGDWLRTYVPLLDLPYTAVYLGIGAAALHAAIASAQERCPKGYRQPIAYHPDIRRRIGLMSAQLEAARWLLRCAAWLLDREGVTPEARTTFFKAKYVVGEAVAAVTRSALEIGGAHAIFKGSAIERLFRDGATATIMFPPSDLCLSSIAIHDLGLDAKEIAPPLQPAWE